MTVCEDMFSRVQEMLPTSSQEAHDYFSRKLRCETDTFDVNFDREREVSKRSIAGGLLLGAWVQWRDESGSCAECFGFSGEGDDWGD